MPALNIGGKVVGVLPTEEIYLELKKGAEDFNYLMSDDSIKHFEFQSTNGGVEDLKRFRVYEAQEEITKADLLPLVLCPLMGGEMSHKERVMAAYDCLIKTDCRHETICAIMRRVVNVNKE